MGILDIFKGTGLSMKDKEQIARACKTTPEVLEKWDKAYMSSLDAGVELSSKQVRGMNDTSKYSEEVSGMASVIASSFLERVIFYDSETNLFSEDFDGVSLHKMDDISEYNSLPREIRPQAVPGGMVRDIGGNTGYELLKQLSNIKGKGRVDKAVYNRFRQGLDILDLDVLTYEMLSMNKNSMSKWLPTMVDSCNELGFFKIPKTKIVKVPMEILQLSRMEYLCLNETTKQIVNKFCMGAFDLDIEKEYFIKTGTFSYKFDFRNARVRGPSEVETLGEYLLFLSNYACGMAGYMDGLQAKKSVYGVSTTNEWVVREYIDDVEGNPVIYNGMPLRTEFRVFVDFDSKEVLGIASYWDEDMMKSRFSKEVDSDTNKMVHDYVTYTAHCDKIKREYNEHKDKMVEEVQKLVERGGLSGQWSIDIMKNGLDFYLIDMAVASNSALSECVPKGKLREVKEEWIPDLSRLSEEVSR